MPAHILINDAPARKIHKNAAEAIIEKAAMKTLDHHLIKL
jgi:hypothetical protein